MHERSNSGPLTVRAYINSLAVRDSDAANEGIAGSIGSDMAVFEVEEEDFVRVRAVRNCPIACQPMLVSQPLTPDVDREVFTRIFPLFARSEANGFSTWDTPAYRVVAKELGIDPDDGRPEYRREDSAMVEALENWIIDPAKPYGADQINVGKVLELIRMDQQPSRTLRDEVRRQLPLYRQFNLPFLAEIERRVAA